MEKKLSLESEIQKAAKAINAQINQSLCEGLLTGTTTHKAAPVASDLNYDALLKMIEDLPPVLREVILWDREECFNVTHSKVQYLLAPLSWQHHIERLFRPKLIPHIRASFDFSGIPIAYDNDRAEKLFAEAKAEMEKQSGKIWRDLADHFSHEQGYDKYDPSFRWIRFF